MDLREALQASARRFCMGQHSRWAQSYQRLTQVGGAKVSDDDLNWKFTEQAYATFPRYLVWQAILDEVERIETRSVPTLDALRRELAAAGSRANTVMTSNPELPPVALAAMDEERESFAHFVRSVALNELESVEPLELRRVFGKEELKEAWHCLDEGWDVKMHHYWWPLREGATPPNVIAFHEDWFDQDKIVALRELLGSHGIDRVWELREFGEWGCEQSTMAFELAYTVEEGYWMSAKVDWLVYASHESSITLAGEWLLEGFRKRFPACDQFTYGGPMSTPDQRGTWKW